MNPEVTEPVCVFVETVAARATGTKHWRPNVRPQSASLFDFYEPLPIQVEVSDAPITSDAGLLPLRQFDDRIGLTQQFAAALHDPRDPAHIDHTFPEMVRSRVFGILAGYADQNDHDTLRTDPVFKLIANRSPDDADLNSQPTLSRSENLINIPSLFRLRDVLIDQFIASFTQPPITLAFDLDAVDDSTHGSQQLSFFHAFYDQYQYLPLVTTCAENDAIVMLSLRHGTANCRAAIRTPVRVASRFLLPRAGRCLTMMLPATRGS